MELLFAWIASIVSGAEPLIIKASSKSLVPNPWMFSIFWVAFSIPLIVIYALFRGAGLPYDWLPIIAMSASAALFRVLYTLSLYKLDVSTVSPLYSLRTVFAVLLGVFLLHEGLSTFALALIAVIILAGPFSAYDEKLQAGAFWQKSIILVIASMFFLALEGYFVNRSANANGYATTLLWLDLLTLVFLLPTLKLANVKKDTLTLKKLKPFIVLGIVVFLYLIFSVEAYSRNLAVSSVIISLPFSMVFAVALSFKYGELVEKHPIKVYLVRFSAAFIMVGSAILLTFNR